MNTPQPSTGPPAPPAAIPTLGSIVGSVLGSVVAAKTGMGADPVVGATIITAITGVVTGLFHWLGTKIGASW